MPRRTSNAKKVFRGKSSYRGRKSLGPVEFDKENLTPPPVKEPIVPLNEHQAEYMEAIRTKDQVFTLGPAGTGKTYIASAMAADALLAGEIKKIILTRPAVTVEEDHGFLPGDISSKMAPWVVPFMEVLRERMGPARFKSANRSGEIEVVPLAFMRGRTLKDAYVILDEAQNTTIGQIKMFLTRMGDGAKVLVNGDVLQDDLDDNPSGLSYVLEIIDSLDLDIPIIEFDATDVIRSGICKVWVDAFERYEDGAN
jgi:phosphate starvation-inducible PhoH-like protein